MAGFNPIRYLLRKLHDGPTYKLKLWTESEAEADRRSWISSVTSNYKHDTLISEMKKTAVTRVRVDGPVPPQLDKLCPELTHLCIKDIKAEHTENICESISLFKKLEVLHLKCENTQYSSPQQFLLPDFLLQSESLSSLRELRLNGFQMSKSCLTQLTNLKVLDLVEVSFLHGDISDLFISLTGLTELHLCHMGLRQVPDGISKLTQLQVLNVSDNNFSSKGLPDIFNNLAQLKELYVSNCHINDLPASIEYLSRLRVLDLVCNEFHAVPSHIFELKELHTFKLSGNSKLKCLDSRIVLPKLSRLAIDECHSLDEPPYAICTQGLKGIRQFYADISLSSTLSLPITTVVVVGQTGAGKTSLVKTLQEGKRVFTHRDPDPSLDEATRVFNYEPVDIDNLSLQFVDLGGHEIYHPTYQLTLRANFIPLIVVNLSQYAQYRKEMNDQAAVRKAFFNWMAHFYLSQPTLGCPILVLTHRDQFSDEEDFLKLKENFLSTSEEVREMTVSEEMDEVDTKHTRVACLSNTCFHAENIFVIGNDVEDSSVFEALKDAIKRKCKEYVKKIPRAWREVEETIIADPPGIVGTFDDLLMELRKTLSVEKEQLKIVLTYMHSAGKLLYYKDIDRLASFVFYDTSAITQLLCVLYDHTNEQKWLQREKKFERPKLGAKVKMEFEQYKSWVTTFRESGVLAKSLLEYLILKETKFAEPQLPLAVDVMHTFKLLHGPIKRNGKSYYIVPSYSVGKFDLSESFDTQRNIQFRMRLLFKGLALPRHTYHQMAMILLEQYPSETHEHTAKKNGASVSFDRSKIRLVHDFENQWATILLTTTSDKINICWVELMKVTHALITHTRSTFKAVGLVCEFYCLHCLLRGEQQLRPQINPPWCEQTRDELSLHDGMSRVTCKRQEDVPAVLKFPCKNLSRKQVTELKHYLTQLRRSIPSSSSTVTQPTRAVIVSTPTEYPSDDGDLSDLTDVEEYPDGDVETFPLSRPSLFPCVLPKIRALYNNPSKVYEMSGGMRGRCLLINNEKFSGLPDATRVGTHVDEQRLRMLFTDLKFELNIVHNATAQVMMSEIHKETRNDNHGKYGMFVLVMLSHGADGGDIYGTDGMTVSLAEIYDLLAVNSFPLMSGKPKFVIVQACSGGRRDLGAQIQTDAPTPTERQASADHSLAVAEPLATSHIQLLNRDDLIIFNSSFANYMSMRHPQHGTLFIKSLTTTFYRHACHTDIVRLCKIVQQRVRKESIATATTFPGVGFGQIPEYRETLRDQKEVYLFPGYDGPGE